MNYADMPYAELKALHDEIGGLLDSKRAEAREGLRAQMEALGFTPEDLTSKKNGKRGPVAAKFRDPDNPANEWSGRGRPPAWMQEHLEAGRDKNDFLINGDAS